MDDQPTSAIVLGAGFAGLLAAHALSKRFDTVTLIDRRQLGDDGSFVEDVPQAEHLHVLLGRGQIIIERLFPGLLRECAGADPQASRNDWGSTTFWANPFGVLPQQPTGIETWQFGRDRLDRGILARLRSIPNLRVRSGRVRGLVGDRAAGRITGVRLVDPSVGPSEEAEATELRADLVVDCRGRTTPVVEELEDLGYPAPAISRVDNELGYSSQFFTIDRGQSSARKLTYVQMRPGLIDRGGAVCQIEDGKLVATMIGTGEHRPGSSSEALLAFAESLAYPEVRDQLRRATPIGKPRLWRNLGNRRRHFGRMREWPRGLIVLGDALCSFNPVYGQGMTVAAVEAEALGEALARVPNPRTTAWEAPFQRRLESLLFIPWLMSSTEDQRNRAMASPGPSTRFLHGYLDLVLKGAVEDPRLQVAFLRVMHMLDSPFGLLSPMVAMRAGLRTVQRAMAGSRRPSGPSAALAGEAGRSLPPR